MVEKTIILSFFVISWLIIGILINFMVSKKIGISKIREYTVLSNTSAFLPNPSLKLLTTKNEKYPGKIKIILNITLFT
jgi:hypothetical protein